MKRLIDEEDAIRAICKNCYAEDGGDYKDCRYYPCDDVQAIEALPSTDVERIKDIMKKANEQDKHMGRPTDLIRRADAIEAVMAEGRKVYTSEYANAERVIHEADAVEALSMLPSAEQVTSKLNLAEAVQGEWKRVETRTYKGECTNCGFRHIFMDGHDSQYRFCPYCGAKMKGGAE